MFCFYAQNQADQRFESQMADNRFNPEQLIRVGLPLNMPYYRQTSWERVSGEIEMNGKVYKYLSRKIENDSLILLCLPDEQRSRLSRAQSGLLANSLGLLNTSTDKKAPSPGLYKSLPDADFDLQKHAVTDVCSERAIRSFLPAHGPALLSGILPTLFRPPNNAGKSFLFLS